MVVIEGFGDDVIFAITCLFIVSLLIIAWLSTQVREFPFPANLLIIERRFRRVYRHSTISPNPLNNAQAIGRHQLIRNSIGINNTTGVTHQQNEIDIVGEVVEQALVDDILDDTLLTADDVIDATESNVNTINVTQHDEPTTSEPVRQQTSNVAASISCTSSSGNEDGNRTQLVNDESNNDCNENSENNNNINILIRFVNETILKIKVQPNDTIGLIKKTYFNQEISNNKVVRFIYQGQFLKDTNTIKSYNIRDQTTIHCHITSRQGTTTTTSTTSNGNNTDISGNNSNHVNNQSGGSNSVGENRGDTSATTRTTTTSALNNTITITRIQINNSVIDENNSTATDTASPNGANSVNAGNNNNANNVEQQHANNQLLNIEFGSVLLPIFTILLASIWYFRMNFKQFFSPLSNLFLFFITFIYTIFLFIHFYQMFTFAHRLTSHARRVNT